MTNSKINTVVIRKRALRQVDVQLAATASYLQNLKRIKDDFANVPLALCVTGQYQLINQQVEKLLTAAIATKMCLAAYLISSGNVKKFTEAKVLIAAMSVPDSFSVIDGVVILTQRKNQP